MRVNCAAYEDIANFFTNEVNGDGVIDGVDVHNHMGYWCSPIKSTTTDSKSVAWKATYDDWRNRHR